jgi:hypothetical protein
VRWGGPFRGLSLDRHQQAEGLITMAKLREKLDGTREERERLRARLAVLADGRPACASSRSSRNL